MSSPVEKAGSFDDVEKRGYDAEIRPVDTLSENGAVHDVIAKHEHGPLAPLWRIMRKLEAFGVESRGIERVPEDARFHHHIWQSATCWYAANCTISTFALGTLGNSIFFLDLRSAVLTVIFFNLLSTLPVAFFSTWGARMGLRQMTISRFSFGPWAALFPTVLNLLACVGWSAINAIAGASALAAVGDMSMPPAAAVVIITVVTLIISFMGYKVVHWFELISAIPITIIFIILAGVSGKYYETDPLSPPGSETAASVLSFGAAILGFGIGWSSLAADYTVAMPANTAPWKIFAWTYAGLNIPLILIESLGAACMTALNTNDEIAALYASNGTGGLLRGCLSPAGGFGQFCLVILGLGIISNNVPNIYSFALTFQVLGPWAQAIPRVVISTVATGICIVLGIVGYDHFESALDTLLVLLAYWLAIYCTILLSEHFIFRRGFKGYDFDDYNQYSKLPKGYAAAFAVCAGIAGAVVGMATVWYVGVLADDISSPYGGDIGFELAGAFAFVAYVPARYLERKKFGY